MLRAAERQPRSRSSTPSPASAVLARKQIRVEPVGQPLGPDREAVVRTPGDALTPEVRRRAGAMFGQDFAGVRVHRGAAAAATSRQAGAHAWTYGSHVVLGDGGSSGRNEEDTLVHELAHVQEGARAAEPTVQFDKADPATGPVAANEILPYPPGARVQLVNLIQPGLLDLAARFDDDNKDVITALRNPKAASVVATIGTSSADLVTASLDTPEIPGAGGGAPTKSFHVEIEIERQANGSFDVMIMWSGPRSGRRWFSGITAQRGSGGRITLAVPGSDPRVAIGAPNDRGERIAVVENLPTLARMLVKDPLEIVELRVVTAAAGSVEAKKEEARTVTETRARYAERNQQASIGIGAQIGHQVDPALTAGWQFTFRPVANALTVPVVVQMDYVPPRSWLIGASAGGQIQTPTRVPVRLRLMGGFKGGQIAEGGPGVSRADRPLHTAVGPTVGAGASVDLGGVTLELDYEHMVNLVKDGPNVKRINLSAGFKF